ncbi:MULTISPECIES: hypothetical protein [Psychrilyobacter]|uniref:Uncharacterized protein n=1 Tax=Psychrilyobacter piezotolerans TaxID=2293438 RepID=A0ABX9KFN8_9FUSO|nr:MULTISPECIES: hypothetical protein [Psychrilyobacter]MCS5421404.1 hypothetical protein [Psychrilyobacter sp. S5]NDI78491.1 hypothetical protein [Psychrilyobacter piezotolerans]RDE60675.1 hypothetical protein DV867_10610 [Psychrilyobacter sp. S5]REI40602.1 hypothetical protein DYH56_10610 [Psychrilyobacter piezotolerans]
MRKMIIFTFLAITIFTYSEVTEIVRDSEGKLIVEDAGVKNSQKNYSDINYSDINDSEAKEIVEDAEGKEMVKDTKVTNPQKNYYAVNDSEAKEIVKDAEGKNIVLKEDKTWEPEKEVESKKEFEKKVKLSNVELSPKRSDGRSLTGSITNKSRKKLEYVTYNVIWKIDGQYSIVKTFTIKNLDYNETKEFNKRIHLKGISGRDYKIEILDFEWED